MVEVISRPCRPADHHACFTIFDSNTPIFFAPAERAEFEQFLRDHAERGWPYHVLAEGDEVVACGGLTLTPETGVARLAWGMVARARHRQGLGEALTRERLAMARAAPGIRIVALETSQHTRGFYERFGFRVARINADGFGPGLDEWEMALKLG